MSILKKIQQQMKGDRALVTITKSEAQELIALCPNTTITPARQRRIDDDVYRFNSEYWATEPDVRRLYINFTKEELNSGFSVLTAFVQSNLKEIQVAVYDFEQVNQTAIVIPHKKRKL